MQSFYLNQLIHMSVRAIFVAIYIFHFSIIHHSEAIDKITSEQLSMNFQQYLDNIPLHRKQVFIELINIINGLYPNIDASMKYKMPTCTNGDGWVALANQKNYISLYTCSLQHLEEFKKKYPKVKTGKGCVNIQDRDDFPVAELASVIISAMEKKYK